MKLSRWIATALMCLSSVTGNGAIPIVSTGFSNSVFMHSDGSVWSVGWNPVIAGPLTTSPVRVMQIPNTIAAAFGANAVFALTADGTLWGAGCNTEGQLGDGTATQRCGLPPQKVPGLTDVKAFAASPHATSSHVLALRQDGTVWSWGGNTSGQLGHGNKIASYEPTKVDGLTDIIRIAAGNLSSAALKSDGTVWVWGQTCCGKRGNGRYPIDDSDPEWDSLIPTQVQSLDKVITISAGAFHHMALRADGTVWVWGSGGSGENGTGNFNSYSLPVQIPGLDNVIGISTTGYRYAAAVKADGTVWTWGSNNEGQLGTSTITYSSIPIQVPGVSDAIAISAGWNHVIALRRDGSVFAWGWNQDGQLGDGTQSNHAVPRPVTGPGGTGLVNLLQAISSSTNQLPQARISASVTSGRAPLTVQFNGSSSTDSDGTIRSFSWTTSDGQQASGPSTTITFAQAGTYNVDLLVEDNSGGSGTARQQVSVLPPAISVLTAPKIAISGQSGIALTTDSRVLTWGAGWKIGLFDAVSAQSLPSANSLPIANGITGGIDVAVGNAALAVLADGTVLGWGISDSGQVGADSQINAFSQPQRVFLPPVSSVAANWYHSLALTRDGRVYSWGGNVDGQLGVGDNENRYHPAEITGLPAIAAIAAGYTFSAALGADGSVWAWGSNFNFQLGDGTSTSSNRPARVPFPVAVAQIFVSSYALFAEDFAGQVWATGYLPASIPGDPGPRTGPRRISQLDGALQIAGGGSHIVVLNSDGTVSTDGNNSSVGLGIQSSGNTSGLQKIPGINDAIAITTIDADFGKASSLVLRRDGTLFAWGANSIGQLGIGTLTPQRTPALVLNESGSGFLDLIPSIQNVIPANQIPPFLVATYSSGDLRATSLFTDIRGESASGSLASDGRGYFAAGNYKVYVAANVPSSTANPYFQLDSSNNWRVLTWPMSEYLGGVALDSQDAVVRAQILQNADLSSPELANTSILVGYGTDPDEMLSAGRYRTIYTVPTQ